MLALISSIEPIFNYDQSHGFRVAMFSEASFEVAPELFWVEYTGDKKEHELFYDNTTNTIKEIPIPPAPPANTQPISQGTQTF
jgi:hypothetical protein